MRGGRCSKARRPGQRSVHSEPDREGETAHRSSVVATLNRASTAHGSAAVVAAVHGGPSRDNGEGSDENGEKAGEHFGRCGCRVGQV